LRTGEKSPLQTKSTKPISSLVATLGCRSSALLALLEEEDVQY